jgi:tyrosine-specific transport protein
MVDKKVLTGTSILVGTCIGAGVLGIPYVAAQAGFLVAIIYIIIIGLITYLINLYLGEVSLRTKQKHQIVGYAEKYLGKRGKKLMEFATIFGIYAAIIAYMVGIGESISFLLFNNTGYSIIFGALFGVFMSWVLWSGRKGLKKYEKIGVGIVLVLLIFIIIFFIPNIEFNNLLGFNSGNIFLPFGVILFALMSFHAIPEINIVLGRDKKKLKKIISLGTIISIIFYALFTLIVVGYMGIRTPEVATLALGKIFVVLGIFTMFTSYLSLGNSLEDDFIFDEHYRKRNAWLLTSMMPIFLFIVIQMFDFFSFTTILSIGGVVSGGLASILILIMNKNSKKKSERKPEYSIKINKFIIALLSLIFITGIIVELFK